MDWPTCSAEGTVDGPEGSWPLTCDLPDRHYMDGESWHRDPDTGTRWRLNADCARIEWTTGRGFAHEWLTRRYLT